MSEVDHLRCTFDSVLKSGSVLDLTLLKRNSLRKLALEIVDRLTVGSKVKKSDLRVLLACEARDNSSGYGV